MSNLLGLETELERLRARQATERRQLEESIRIELAKVELRIEEVKSGLPKYRWMIDPIREKELELLTYALRDLRSLAEIQRKTLQASHDMQLYALRMQARQN